MTTSSDWTESGAPEGAGVPTAPLLPNVSVALPVWVHQIIDLSRSHERDEDRMALVIELARLNVKYATGGPFAAAVFEAGTGRIVSVGVNMVIPRNNSVLHGEMVAFMIAQARVGSYTLAAAGMPVHELFTSCEPCAMCLGASLWAGVRRIVCGATREDAQRLEFDEGPVFKDSYRYLEERGVTVVHAFMRNEAAKVFDFYLESGGSIYNG